MLQKLRKSLVSVVVFFILALLIASFALWGAGGSFGSQSRVVAKVGDTEISVQEVRDSFDGEMQRIREQFGPTVTNEQALAFGVHRQVLAQLILNAALNEEADRLGLLGSDEEVRQLIRQMPFFHDIRGEFSEVTYEQTLSNRGWTKEEFEDQVRVDIARQQLVEGMTETALVPNLMQNILFDYRKESRRAEMATIPPTSVSDIAPPTDEELQEFFETGKENYRTPEYRDLSFIILSPDAFAQEGNFTDEELRAEYDRRYDEFVIPERRAFQVVVLRNEDEVNELQERVAAGEDFTAVATELTGATSEDLLGGPSSMEEIKANYSDLAANAVFTTDVNDITEPLETLVSWQVFRILEIFPGSEKTFEDVREELRQDLSAEMGVDALFDTVNAIDDEIAAGASVEEIAETVGVQSIHIPAVNAQGQTPEGELITETEVFPFLQRAFAMHLDDELYLDQLEDSETFYLIQVNDITEPQQQEFEDVKAQVRQVWLQEENVRRLGAVAQEALEAAKGGESLTSIAQRYGGVRFETDTYVRDRVFTQRELSPGLASVMFSLGLGEVGIEQDSRGSGYVLVKVIEITKHEPSPDDYEYQALKGRLSVELKNDLFFQFEKKLEDILEIEINEELLEGMFDPDFQQSQAVVSGQ